jgi:hypothetical protein
MEREPDTTQLKYSPTSTPILDVLRPLPKRRWLRLNAGEYFFLSGAVILGLIGLPALRRITESLAARGPLLSLLIPCVFMPGAALLLSLAAHEAGHLSAAWLAGFGREKNQRATTWKSQGGEREWLCDVLGVAALSLEPRKPDHIRTRLFFLFAAGPAANFIFPAILETLAWAGDWGRVAVFFVHLVTGVSALQGIADLLPDTGRGSFSDGSRMLMLLKNDALAQRWLSIIEMQMALRRGQNPASWDETIVAGVNAIGDESRDTLAARWLGYLWATGRQDITTATRYLENALESPQAATGRLCGRLYFEAALFQAWFRDDAGKARFWAGQMRKVSAGPLQQPRLAIALMWADGKLFDAWESLRDYLRELQELPASPARDLAEKQAREWKAQMESRMLTRAWRTIYSMSQEVESSAPAATTARV